MKDMNSPEDDQLMD